MANIHREMKEENVRLKKRNEELVDTLRAVARYSPPDAYAPEGELRLELSPVMNERVLRLLRESGL